MQNQADDPTVRDLMRRQIELLEEIRDLLKNDQGQEQKPKAASKKVGGGVVESGVSFVGKKGGF